MIVAILTRKLNVRHSNRLNVFHNIRIVAIRVSESLLLRVTRWDVPAAVTKGEEKEALRLLPELKDDDAVRFRFAPKQMHSCARLRLATSEVYAASETARARMSVCESRARIVRSAGSCTLASP